MERESRAALPFETSLPGVFAAGDVRYGSVKRVAGAVGEGSVAVGSVHRYLAGLEARTSATQPGSGPQHPRSLRTPQSSERRRWRRPCRGPTPAHRRYACLGALHSFCSPRVGAGVQDLFAAARALCTPPRSGKEGPGGPRLDSTERVHGVGPRVRSIEPPFPSNLSGVQRVGGSASDRKERNLVVRPSTDLRHES